MYYLQTFEDADYNNKDIKCPSYELADDIFFREDFGDIVENCYCVIQLKNKKRNNSKSSNH